MSDLENTYWNSNGKYQAASDKIAEMVPDSGASDKLDVETYRIAANAYYDYFNNGGCNRFRLTELKRIHLKRGTPGSKALSKLKTYAPRDPDRDFAGYMPDNLAPLYEDLINGVIEQQFPELIEQKVE